jgi:hypothetical protein
VNVQKSVTYQDNPQIHMLNQIPGALHLQEIPWVKWIIIAANNATMPILSLSQHNGYLSKGGYIAES